VTNIKLHNLHTVFTLNQYGNTNCCCVPHNVQLKMMLHMRSSTLKLLWCWVERSNMFIVRYLNINRNKLAALTSVTSETAL
jgi:hypothetical protein